MNDIEIIAYCYSEKADVSIGFGLIIKSADELKDLLDTNWIDEGLVDSFWENHYAFEPGLAEAEAICNRNHDIAFRDALFSIFGYFSMRYEVNGEKTALSFEFNANDMMYALLEK
jgi:hypothetical protein